MTLKLSRNCAPHVYVRRIPESNTNCYKVHDRIISNLIEFRDIMLVISCMRRLVAFFLVVFAVLSEAQEQLGERPLKIALVEETINADWEVGGQFNVTIQLEETLQTYDHIVVKATLDSRLSVEESAWGEPAEDIIISLVNSSLQFSFNATATSQEIILFFNVYSTVMQPLSLSDVEGWRVFSLETGFVPVQANGSIKAFESCGTGKYIAWTFDDAPVMSFKATETILDYFSGADMPNVTFFVAPAGGGEVQLEEKCALISRMAEQGHQVQSHSWTHSDFKDLTLEEIQGELDRTRDFITECTQGLTPIQFRPPYGSLTFEQAEYITAQGYVISLWNVDSFDWENANEMYAISESIAEGSAELDGNSIVLLSHDRSSYGIVRDLHEWIVEEFINSRGYSFIQTTECYQLCDTLIENGICKDPVKTHWMLSEWLIDF